MSVTVVHSPTGDPAGPGRTTPSSRTRRRASHLRPVPNNTSGNILLAISVSLDAGADRTRFVQALHDLIAAGGPETSIALQSSNPESAPSFFSGNPSAEPTRSNAGPVEIYPGPRAAFHRGTQLRLSRLEFDLMLFFAEHPRQVFTRLQLLTQVWETPHVGVRTIDVHIRRLRAKLGRDVPLVTTVYGVGYRLADDADIAVHPI